jgi:HAD superfamily hydrolase (TIGR01509 family)
MDFKNIKGVIFDLDGTLLDSMHVWDKIDHIFLAERGIELPDDYQQAIAVMNCRSTAVYTIERFGLKETVDEVVAQWQGMARREYAVSLRLKPGAADYLRRLSQKGIKIALATGSGRELFEAALKNNGVYSLFDAFVTLDDVERDKCFPDIYLKAAGELGLEPSQCLVFEDILTGICSAKAAGMRVIAVYDDWSAGVRGSIEREADGFITDFTRLAQAVTVA